MQKFKRIAKSFVLGLFSTCLIAIFASGIFAQGVPGVKTATQTATSPLKATQSGIKEVVQPVKDLNKGIQEVSRAPKTVTNEIKRTNSEIKNAENEVKRTEKSIEKITGTGDGKGDKKPEDSVATQNAAQTENGNSDADVSTRKTPIPPDYVPPSKATGEDPTASETPNKATNPKKKGELPFYSRDNKTPSGPWPKSEMSKNAIASGGVDANAGVNSEVGADGKQHSNSNSKTTSESASMGNSGTDTERLVNIDPEFRTEARRSRPDYSGSPARIALEKAEYDLETLDELFKYSNWEGPEREHTVRAVGYALDDLQNAIFEIKRIDPAQSTFRFERRYKEMKAAYKAEIEE